MESPNTREHDVSCELGGGGEGGGEGGGGEGGGEGGGIMLHTS